MIKIKNFPDLQVDWLLFLIIPLVIMGGYVEKYIITYFSIIVHEMGHIAAALFFSKAVVRIKILPIGLNAEIEEGTDRRWKYILIYSSGPFLNILLSAVALILSSYYLKDNGNMRFFILINIYLAVFNLLPVLPLDGGRILNELLKEHVGLIYAARYTRRVSLVLCMLMIAVGLVQVFTSLYNFSLLFVSIFILFTLKQGKTEAALMNVKNIIFRRSRLLKKGVYPARDLVVVKSTYLGETIKNMDFDRFHFIHVLDEDLRLVRIYSEQEVVQVLLEGRSDMTFEDLLKKEKS